MAPIEPQLVNLKLIGEVLRAQKAWQNMLGLARAIVSPYLDARRRHGILLERCKAEPEAAEELQLDLAGWLAGRKTSPRGG